MPLRGTTAGENVVAAPRFREYSPPGRVKRRQALGWVVTRKQQYPPRRSATAVATVKASQAFTPSNGVDLQTNPVRTFPEIKGRRFLCLRSVPTKTPSPTGVVHTLDSADSFQPLFQSSDWQTIVARFWPARIDLREYPVETRLF